MSSSTSKILNQIHSKDCHIMPMFDALFKPNAEAILMELKNAGANFSEKLDGDTLLTRLVGWFDYYYMESKREQLSKLTLEEASEELNNKIELLKSQLKKSIERLLSLIKFLMKHGVDIKQNDKHERNVLQLFVSSVNSNHVESEYTQVIDFFLDHGMDVMIKDRDNKNLMHQAAFKGDDFLIQYLYDKGISIDAIETDYDRSALHIAASQGHINAVRLLVTLGADTGVLDKELRTALQLSQWMLPVRKLTQHTEEAKGFDKRYSIVFAILKKYMQIDDETIPALIRQRKHKPSVSSNNQDENIIFLDIDGVIYDGRGGLIHREKLMIDENYNAKKDPRALKRIPNEVLASLEYWDVAAALAFINTAVKYVLQLCINNNAKIVISSDWRKGRDIRVLKALLAISYLSDFIIGCTSILDSRGHEIATWLLEYRKAKSIVIIDDEDNGICDLFKDEFVQCPRYLDTDRYRQAEAKLQVPFNYEQLEDRMQWKRAAKVV